MVAGHLCYVLFGCIQKKYFPLFSEFLSEPSMVLAEQVMTIDKQQIRKYLGKIKREDMRAIDDVLRISLGLVIPEDVEVAC